MRDCNVTEGVQPQKTNSRTATVPISCGEWFDEDVEIAKQATNTVKRKQRTRTQHNNKSFTHVIDAFFVCRFAFCEGAASQKPFHQLDVYTLVGGSRKVTGETRFRMDTGGVLPRFVASVGKQKACTAQRTLSRQIAAGNPRTLGSDIFRRPQPSRCAPPPCRQRGPDTTLARRSGEP